MQSSLVGYRLQDSQKLELHLKKLFNHVDLDSFILAGGTAIRYHLVNHDVDYPLRPTNDLDALLTRADALKPSVAEDFKISHYHINDASNRDRFYFALVDAETKTKIDLFDADVFTPHPVTVDFYGTSVQMRSLEDQLVTKIMEMLRVLYDQKVDTEWFEDTQMLIKFANMDKAQKYWEENVAKPFFVSEGRYAKYSGPAEAWEAVVAHLQKHTELLSERVHRKEKPYVCEGCTISKDFPLTPLEDIYKILGYIE